MSDRGEKPAATVPDAGAAPARPDGVAPDNPAPGADDEPAAGRGLATWALGLGVVLALVAVVGGVGLATGLFGRATLRALPNPIRQAIVLVPIGGFPVDQATAIRDRLAGDYGLPITVAPTVPFDSATVDPGRGQLVSEGVADQLRAAHPEWRTGVLVIGLTELDTYIAARPNWLFAFGYRDGGGVGVVSSARMRQPFDVPDATSTRLRKMVIRDVAFLYYGLKATSDPADLLYDNILSLADLDRIGDRL